MEKENIIIRKTFSFALRIIKLYNFLRSKENEFILSKQILKSGTSIGANVEEAEGGQSKPDFICKIQIALKEARETNYWLRLVSQAKIVSEKDVDFFIKESDEILRVISQIIINSQNNSKSVERTG